MLPQSRQAPRGLSPRVRGSLVAQVERQLPWGSIPAGAGEPFGDGPSRTFRRVYPRGCGGALSFDFRSFCGMGLSPRVRGSQFPPTEVVAIRGSIPAGAGEPVRQRVSRRSRGVYPRGCGGAREKWNRAMVDEGLSPRVRGSQKMFPYDFERDGSIPAGAGEPPDPGFALRPIWVYPRGCGGANSHDFGRGQIRGLSPRVRGSPSGNDRDNEAPGSIPAGAGEPEPCRHPMAGARVYPRGCGGASRPNGVLETSTGLSPRVRGSHRRVRGRGPEAGSIPAGAGEPRSQPSPRWSVWVYPRGCGGAGWTTQSESSGHGLSPRVRGSRRSSRNGQAKVGSIPAGAGEPSPHPPAT